jgi:hypothetical protein
MCCQGRLRSRECLRDPPPPALVDNPTKRQFAVEPHVGQEPDHGPVVCLFRLLNDVADDKLIEYLPDSHGSVGFDNAIDRGLDLVDFGL